jgi:hypothetical protein
MLQSIQMASRQLAEEKEIVKGYPLNYKPLMASGKLTGGHFFIISFQERRKAAHAYTGKSKNH